jgi:hypothetical protein
VCTETGLLGIALDPDFTTNGWVYLYRTQPLAGCGPHVNQVVRITIAPDGTVDPGSLVEILGGINSFLARFSRTTAACCASAPTGSSGSASATAVRRRARRTSAEESPSATPGRHRSPLLAGVGANASRAVARLAMSRPGS